MVVGDDHVVMHGDAEDASSVSKLSGDPDVFPARFRVPAGVIVEENDARRRLEDRRLEDLPGVDKGGVEDPGRDGDVAEEPVGAVEEEDLENLALEVAQGRPEMPGDAPRRRDRQPFGRVA